MVVAVSRRTSNMCVSICIWGFPKIRGTFLGAPIIRIIVYWVYIGVPLFTESTIYIYIYISQEIYRSFCYIYLSVNT